MSNISINRTGNPHSFAHKVTAKSSSDNDPSSFENILNQQVGSSAPSVTNRSKVASTGISDSMPKEYRDRKLAQMEYEIAHGHTEDMELTENGYIPKLRSLCSPEYYAVRDRLEAYNRTPEGQKEFLLFGNAAVKAIVQDKEGNIVAKFYTDDMTGIDPQKITNAIWDGENGGLSTNESIKQLEKRSYLTVVKYGDSSKVTDFDLLKYEVNQANEKIKVNPEFRDTYNKMAKAMHPEIPENVTDVLAFQESILVA